jgi:hypothetical protein
MLLQCNQYLSKKFYDWVYSSDGKIESLSSAKKHYTHSFTSPSQARTKCLLLLLPLLSLSPGSP